MFVMSPGAKEIADTTVAALNATMADILPRDLIINYTAWNTATNAGQTGDAANHALRWIKDGIAAAPQYTPSEVDPVNAPGIYRILLSSTERVCDVGTLCGTSSTANVIIIPLTLTFDECCNPSIPGTGTPPAAATPALTLAQIKEYLRLVDDGGQDNLLTDLLAAAQESIAMECDLLTGDPANWPALPKLAIKMTVAGLYANPESLRMQELFESPAIRRIINLFKSWVPA